MLTPARLVKIGVDFDRAEYAVHRPTLPPLVEKRGGQWTPLSFFHSPSSWRYMKLLLSGIVSHNIPHSSRSYVKEADSTACDWLSARTDRKRVELEEG